MDYAIDCASGDRVSICDARRHLTYECPTCGFQVYPRRPRHKEHHFYHCSWAPKNCPERAEGGGDWDPTKGEYDEYPSSHDVAESNSPVRNWTQPAVVPWQLSKAPERTHHDRDASRELFAPSMLRARPSRDQLLAANDSRPPVVRARGSVRLGVFLGALLVLLLMLAERSCRSGTAATEAPHGAASFGTLHPLRKGT